MKDQARAAIVRLLKLIFTLAGWRGRRMAIEALRDGPTDALWFEPIVEIATSRGALKFSCPNELLQWRAETLLTKEAETIDWIDTFQPGETLWDIGANAGIYSVYAGLRNRVLSFEPGAGNYFILNRNVELNDLAGAVSCYCVALSDTTAADRLNMQHTGIGTSLSCFGAEIDEAGKPFTPSYRQATLGFSIDTLIALYGLEFPNHIKIDVDGIEQQILTGGRHTIADPRLRSVSIEIDADRPDQAAALDAALQAAGLHQVCTRQSPMMAAGKYRNFFNRVYQRDVSAAQQLNAA